MRVVSGADWSVGLNSMSSNAVTERATLSKLGVGLRGLYGDLVAEPLPERLTLLVGELRAAEQGTTGKAE